MCDKHPQLILSSAKVARVSCQPGEGLIGASRVLTLDW